MSVMLAAAAAGLLGSGINAQSQSDTNRRAENFSREMYMRQRADTLSDWHMQNSYNDPSAQMSRLKGAGLNPNLVYGTGADAMSQAPVRASQSSQPNFQAPKFDMGSVVFNALQTKQLQSNIARTDAETEAIKSRTVDQDFKNQVNQAIGVEQMRYQYETAVNRMSTAQNKELVEFEAQLTAGYANPRDPNSPAVKALRAGYERVAQELENAKVRGDVLGSEAAIKAFEKRLTDQGISPNSPFYLKTIMSLLEKVGLSIF